MSIGTKTLTWMNGRELATYSDGNNIYYKYNLNGIRTSKIVNNVTTNYYLEDTSIIFENRNGTMLYYLYNGDELLGFIYNNNTYYYHKNMFGDIVGIYNSNYNEIVKYEYDNWGVIKNITDNSNINLGIINPFRYRSYYYDEETQLYYLNSRYYNPEIGRFINADSLVSTGQFFNGNNMFIYCGNNPTNRKENGKGWWIVASAVVGGIVGGAAKVIENKVNGKKWNEDLAGAVVGGATYGGVLAATGSIGQASIAGATAESVTNQVLSYTSASKYLVGKEQKELTKENLINSALDMAVDIPLNTATLYITGNVASNVIKTNSGWFKPQKLLSSIVGKYALKSEGQTVLQAGLTVVANSVLSSSMNSTKQSIKVNIISKIANCLNNIKKSIFGR